MQELPSIIPPVLSPAALFAAFAPPCPEGFTWINPEERAAAPKEPPFTIEQRELFNGWRNDAFEPEEIHDTLVTNHIYAMIQWRRGDDAWLFRNRRDMEIAWRWHWAKSMLDAAPRAALFPSHSYLVEQGELSGTAIVMGAERRHTLPLPLDRALEAAAVERARQVHELGYTAAHDDEHDKGELACAAAWYALPVDMLEECDPDRAAAYAALWPADWGVPESSPTPTTAQRKRELEKAIALLAAEWDRIDRVERRS